MALTWPLAVGLLVCCGLPLLTGGVAFAYGWLSERRSATRRSRRLLHRR